MVCIQKELDEMTIHPKNSSSNNVTHDIRPPPVGNEPYANIGSHPSAGSTNLCNTGNWMGPTPDCSAAVGGLNVSGAFGTCTNAAQSTFDGQPHAPYGKASGFTDMIFGCMRPLDRLFSFSFKSAANETGGNGRDCVGINGKGLDGVGGYKRGQWEIPFEEILELEWVGSGAQGTVFSGQLHDEIVAVKKVRDLKETDIKHLRKLDHENIIKFK